jgi:tRNA(Ile)-lysidine synthase
MTWTNYHSRLHQTLRTKNLLPQKSKILIAVSGGQDSLCLAKLILDLQSKWQWQIAIAHCDHSWELDQGLADHVASICQTWQVRFYLEKAPEKISETEAEARTWRYQRLIKIAQESQFNYVLTGHTLSDRSETLLYNLIRGSGLDGLSALTWTRNLTDKIKLVRPLLNFSRSDTLKFCQQFNLPIWADQYNYNKKFARNRIRLDLIPYLQDNFNRQIEQTLAQTAEIFRAEREYLEQQAQQLFQLAITHNQQSLKRSVLANQPLCLQRRVIKLFLAQGLRKMPSFSQIEAVKNLIDAPNRSRTSTLVHHTLVEVQNDLIALVKLTNL